jgi:hypothetical protein
MDRPSSTDAGSSLAREVCAEIDRLGLRDNLTALYRPHERTLRLRWRDSAEALDVPATEEWARRLGECLRAYASTRRMQ